MKALNPEHAAMDEWNRYLLAKIPQKEPFRFIDRIVKVNPETIIGQYETKAISGLFGRLEKVPQPLLIEMMAQTGVVAHGIYLAKWDEQKSKGEPSGFLTLFTDVKATFFRNVCPDQVLTIVGRRVFWRKLKLRTEAYLYRQNGELVATAMLSGLGVKKKK